MNYLSDVNKKYAEEAQVRIQRIAKNGTIEEKESILKILVMQNADLRDEIKRRITERANYVNWMLIATGALFSFAFACLYYYVFAVVAAPFVLLSYWRFYQNSYLAHQKVVNFLRDFVEPQIELLSNNVVRGWQRFLKDQHKESVENCKRNSTSQIERNAFTIITLIVAPVMFLALYIVQTIWCPPLPPKVPIVGNTLMGVFYIVYIVSAIVLVRRANRKLKQEGII